MYVDTAIVLLAKTPEAGSVKTRLEPFLGRMLTLKLYTELLQYCLQQLVELPNQLYIFVGAKEGAKADCNHITWQLLKRHRHCIVKPQPQYGDLGLRIKKALSTVFQNHNRAIIIGADCPEITKRTISQCQQYLEKNDVVINPATDGGYVMLGLNKFENYEQLFNEINWGSSTVYSQTIKNIEQLNLNYATLPPLRDIDLPKDLIVWQLKA